MEEGTGGDMSQLGPGGWTWLIEKASYQPTVIPWQGYVWCLGEGFDHGNPRAPSSHGSASLPPSPSQDGTALTLAGAGCSEGLRGKLLCSRPHQIFHFLWLRALAAQAVTSVTVLMLRECPREEMTAADCDVAGASGKAEVELPCILLSKCFLAFEGTTASGNLKPILPFLPLLLRVNVDHQIISKLQHRQWCLGCWNVRQGHALSLLNFFSFWTETTEMWSFLEPQMVCVPKGVCRRPLILTYFLYPGQKSF